MKVTAQTVHEKTKSFNESRMNHSGNYTKDEMKEILGFKSDNYFTTAIKVGIIIKIRNGKSFSYRFPEKPIHYKKVKRMYNLIYASMEKAEKKLEVMENEVDVAIALLKSLNYKIYKPTVEYTEI